MTEVPFHFGEEFKFRMEGNDAFSLGLDGVLEGADGGAMVKYRGDLKQGGANITLPMEGYWTITLDVEKKAMEARQRELEAQAERAAGRNEQIDEAERKKSSVRKVWEEVTGKDQERKKQQEENESIQTRSKRDVEEINRSIDEAAETLKMLNTKLAELEEMRQKAEDMKDKAMKTYEEHEETVQKILRFFESAMDMFGSLSSKG